MLCVHTYVYAFICICKYIKHNPRENKQWYLIKRNTEGGVVGNIYDNDKNDTSNNNMINKDNNSASANNNNQRTSNVDHKVIQAAVAIVEASFASLT